MQRGDPQFNVRLAGDLRERMTELAKTNGRSVNAEFNVAVEAYLSGSVTIGTADEKNAAVLHELTSLRLQNGRLQLQLDQSDMIIKSSKVSLKFYEHSVRVLAQSVLAANLALPSALKKLLDEWAAYNSAEN